jgi:hypothetical protein
MIIGKLSAAQFKDTALVFEGFWTEQALIDSVPEERQADRGFVDDVRHPTSCLLCKAIGG